MAGTGVRFDADCDALMFDDDDDNDDFQFSKISTTCTLITSHLCQEAVLEQKDK